MKTMKVKITLLESMLGTAPADADVYRNYIGGNAPDASSLEEEIAAIGVDEVANKGRTVFPRLDDGTPFLYDYQIKGFFKDACGMLNRLTKKEETVDENGKVKKSKKTSTESGKLKAYKKEIDGLIFVEPRKIPIVFDGEVGDCQRPLRAQTMQGERVTLASSDEVPAGATMTFTIALMNDEHETAVREWLDYGRWRGLGQWRNSGKGRFSWEEAGN